MKLDSIDWICIHAGFLTRSIKIHWLLNELELPFEIVRHSISHHQSKISLIYHDMNSGQHTTEPNPHPLKKVPCIEYKMTGSDSKHVLFETNAILLFLLACLKDGGDEKDLMRMGERLQWIFYTDNTFEMEAVHPFRLVRELCEKKGVKMGQPVPMDTEETSEFENATKNVKKCLEFIEKQLSSQQEFLLGDEFDVADICVGYCLRGMQMIGLLSEDTSFPHCREYLNRLVNRPAFKKTLMESMATSMSNK